MNTLKTTFLLALLTGLLMAVGNYFGGTTGMMFMLVFSLGMNFFSYWYSDKIVLKMYNAKEVNKENAPDLLKLVANLAKSANMPMPRVYIIENSAPNAFATGRNPQNGVVAVTTGILKVLNYDELSGVIAHELAHIKNRDTLTSTIVASIAGFITMVAHIAQWALIFGMGRDEDEGAGSLVGSLLLIIVAPLAATIIQLAISRSREFAADETGAKICQNPKALATALKKIEAYAMQGTKMQQAQANPSTSHLFIINPLSGAGSFVSSLFSTHPKTADRVAKLEQMA
ncbi:zinc metalloprotease HtpX [Selenomonadales bacterium OttesenSCG-928-I06]|nr:zinc metalloprotease HtpX [Selenomonadales bacterium OttesenSCG-928-I06]